MKPHQRYAVKRTERDETGAWGKVSWASDREGEPHTTEWRHARLYASYAPALRMANVLGGEVVPVLVQLEEAPAHD